MLTAPSDSLYGRIIYRYFGFGLTCIGLLLTLSLFDHWSSAGRSAWVSAVASAAPLTVLWLGGLKLRQLLTTPEQILSQLSDLSEQPDVEQNKLVPITDAEPAAAGWNRLLQHMYAGGLSAGLEKKLASALLGTENSSHVNVLNTLSDGVAVTDASGTVTSSNHAFRAVLGLPADETPVNSNILPILNRLSEETELPEALSAGRVTRTRFELNRSGEHGSGVLRVACVPMYSENEDSDLFVWTVRDITQQKLAEQMRTEFVETATHELRTPLANIRAYAETLQLTEDIPVQQQKEFINIINAESTRLGRFVDELLNLSQMDAGQITVSRHETDFERLLQECIEHTRPQMDKKSQHFETQIPARLPVLNLDKDKIASCLVNLIGNAAKYTPEGGQIRLIVEESATELSIRVEDTGYGISEEELPRIFHRFYRSNDDRVREECGSGLGLAYTQEVVRLHGGRLTVDSKLDQGSQFTLSLPLL